MSSGIYCITHTRSGKRYIGSSINIEQRIRQHISQLKRNTHHSITLQRAWNKYGSSEFKFITLFLCDAEHTLWYEQRCLDELQPEYNSAIFVDGGMRGRKHTTEARQKISDALTGKCLSDEHRLKLSEIRISHPVAEETRKKISKKLIGHKHQNEETRMKMSERAKNKKVAPICHPDRKHVAKGLCGSCYVMFRTKVKQNIISDTEIQKYLNFENQYTINQSKKLYTEEEKKQKRNEQQRNYYKNVVKEKRKLKKETASLNRSIIVTAASLGE